MPDQPASDDVAILRKLLMSLPYWPTEAFAALERIESAPLTQADVDAAYQRGLADGQDAQRERALPALFGFEPRDRVEAAAMERAYRKGLAEGRTHATEGWEREWAVDFPGHTWPPNDSEQSARTFAACHDDGRVVSRLVGPWEPAEQTEAAPVVERLSAETIASTLAIVDAPYRPGLDVKYLDEEPATGGVVEPSGPLTAEDGCTLTVPIRPRPRMTDGCGPEHTYRGTCAYANEGADRG